MRLPALVLAGSIVLLSPAAPRAWGLEVHRMITARAVDAVPGAMGDLLRAERAFVVEHAVDPDLWRVVDLRGELGTENANHFLDIDALDEPAPYDGVPRDWQAFVARYGRSRANRAGRLPWRVEDIYDRLVTAVRTYRAGGPPYAADDVRYLSAALAHYVEDAFVPLHAVANYDGQSTGQRGVHGRFETALVVRYRRQLRLPAVTIAPIADPKTFIFSTIVESAALAPQVLEADRAARGDADEYDTAYYRRLFAEVRPVLEQRLSAAANAVASLLATAWDRGAPTEARAR